MLRNIIAIVAAPIVWGLVGVPVNQVILSFFPATTGGDFSNTILVVTLVASFAYSIIAGAAAVLIARPGAARMGLYAGLAVLLVGLGVQLGSWATFPLWYHLVFLIALPPFCMLGASLGGQRRLNP